MIRSKIMLSCPQHFLQYKSMGKCFDVQGHVTLKQIVCLKWNASKILCLSSLSASLKRIRSKLKALSCPQHFFRRSSAGNSEVNGMMWPEFDLIRDSRTPGYLQVWWWYDQQVAQRATIAHLSPMCQDQISFQKTYKWAMETRGPKSNSSEL